MSAAAVHKAWLNLLEHLGPYENWGPMKARYRRAFWSQSMGYADRLLATAFCYQNGVSMTVLEDFENARQKCRFKIIKMKQLYAYWNHEEEGYERRARFWAYDLYSGSFNDLNGQPKPGQHQYYRI